MCILLRQSVVGVLRRGVVVAIAFTSNNSCVPPNGVGVG